MSIDEAQMKTFAEKTAVPYPTIFSPVTIHLNDTVGSVLLGLIALIRRIAFLQAEAHLRRRKS